MQKKIGIKDALKMFFLLFLMIIMTGCEKKQTKQEITIHYQANDGEFVENIEPIDIKEDMEKALKKEKKKVILATSSFSGMESPYQQLVRLFNNESEEYYVELNNYEIGINQSEAIIRINAEIGAGTGPDILVEDLFPIDQENLDNGALVDLTPYLMESNITSDNYFPSYASLVSGNRIYGVSPSGGVISFAVKQNILGKNDPPEIEELLEALLAYPPKASFLYANESGTHILDFFLDGSESLLGSVDWGKRTCDFTAPMFLKAVDVAKRYSEDSKKGYDAVMSLYFPGLSNWGLISKQVESSEEIMIGYYFDDGRHPRYDNSGYTLVINSNTENLDGAYAFLSFAMSAKGQNYFPEPVHRGIWEAKYLYQMELIEEGRSQWILNENIKNELLAFYEDGKYLPKQTEKIREIILEEMNKYFNGEKTKEEVLNVIQNRVQLYLVE